MGRRQLGRHRRHWCRRGELVSTQLRACVDEVRLEVADVLDELGVLRAQGLRIVLSVRKRGQQRARLGRVLLLHRLDRHLVVFMLWRGRPRLRTRLGDRRRRGRLCRTRGARCARGRGRRIVGRRFGMRHRARHVPTAPRARDRACFGHRDSTGGKRTLIAVAEAPHAPKARSRAVVGIVIEQAGGCERLGRAWAEPFHGAGSR